MKKLALFFLLSALTPHHTKPVDDSIIAAGLGAIFTVGVGLVTTSIFSDDSEAKLDKARSAHTIQQYLYTELNCSKNPETPACKEVADTIVTLKATLAILEKNVHQKYKQNLAALQKNSLNPLG